jgi:hypothetical protein
MSTGITEMALTVQEIINQLSSLGQGSEVQYPRVVIDSDKEYWIDDIEVDQNDGAILLNSNPIED